jgi:hypothetical protein
VIFPIYAKITAALAKEVYRHAPMKMHKPNFFCEPLHWLSPKNAKSWEDDPLIMDERFLVKSDDEIHRRVRAR